MSETMKREDMQREGNYDVFDGAAPAGYDPDAKGRVPLAPGWYRAQVSDFTIIQDNEFKYKGDRCILDKLQVNITVTEGPGTGGAVIDFLPLPPRKGQPTPLKEIANQWACFARCAGFTLTAASLVPAEWVAAIKANKNPYDTMMGREFYVRLQQQTDKDGIPQFGRDGEAWMCPAFFGYRSVAEGPLTPAAVSAAAPTAKVPKKAPVAAADLGEL